MHEVQRVPVRLSYREPEDVSAAPASGTLEGQLLLPSGVDRSVCLVLMHPVGLLWNMPMSTHLASAGLHVACCGTRYPKDGSALILEHCLVDLAHWVKFLKEEKKYKRVVFYAWSAGASLMITYQAQAVSPSITHLPSGEKYDLTAAGSRGLFTPVDGIVAVAPHKGRAQLLQEWLDPAVTNENDPDDNRDATVDMFATTPPYSAEWVERYRDAQCARMRRITAWVKEKLQALPPGQERGFVVHGTCADPRWRDPQLDANDRKPGRNMLGDPAVANMSPGGLGRYNSLKSWLSMWSAEDSQIDALRHAPSVAVPYYSITGTADDGCPITHPEAIYNAIASASKAKHDVKGANHFFGVQEHGHEIAGKIQSWLETHALA